MNRSEQAQVLVDALRARLVATFVHNLGRRSGVPFELMLAQMFEVIANAADSIGETVGEA